MRASSRASATRLASTLLAFGLLAVACGADGSDAESEDSVPPATRPPSTEAPGSDESGGDGSEEPPAETYPPNGESVDVLALDNNFRDETVEVAAGTEVVWDNRGRNDHNILPVDDTQDWGVPVEDFIPGDQYSRVFDTPGEYPYYCSLHGTADFGMIGTIIVTP